MKTITSHKSPSRARSYRIQAIAAALFAIAVDLIPPSSQAQAPGLLWSTNVNGRVFAVDNQTNVYATAGTNVLVFNRAGVLQQSSTVCPVPGIAQRDAAGNLYFAGVFDGTQDFGGVVLVGGRYNNNLYTPGYPSGYLAKYNGGGNLQWALKFGVNGIKNFVSDLQPDLNGGCFVGYWADGQQANILHVSASGSNEWVYADGSAPQFTQAGMRLGGITSSNCFWITLRPYFAPAGRIDLGGTPSGFYLGSPFGLGWPDGDGANTKPIIDDLAQAFQVGTCFPPYCGNTNPIQVLRKYTASGSLLFDVPVGTEPQWALARDPQANLYLAGSYNLLAKYSSDGILIWTTNYGNKIYAMAVDGTGNRFVSFADGTVGRLADDPAPVAASIATGPQSQTVFVGDNVSFSVAANGTQPLRYFWRRNGTNIAGATASSYYLSSVTLSQTGSYSVVITNAVSTVTSAPAVLRIKQLELYAGSLLLSNTTYVFTSAPTLSIRSAFTNGSAFYTTDGSAPTFNSTYYSGPFVLSSSATVRAIGYTADFSNSEQADTVTAIVLERHTLTTSASGGGSVNPTTGSYISTNVVTVTATPLPGWTFMYWLGDASGINPTINVSMERDKFVYAVFGTSLSTTVAGSGHVELYPAAGPYAYGSTVRLTGVPNAGNYFGFWGNAATGNTNPLYFTITAPTQTISSIFGTLAADQAALTILINGNGRVTANPRANVYLTNQTVTLTAQAEPGQSFLNWTGDASGSQNPLLVQMNQSRVITANFSGRPALRVGQPGEGLTPQGFRFTLLSEPNSVWQILATTNLNNWISVGTVTNSTGEVQFTDPGATGRVWRFYKATQ